MKAIIFADRLGAELLPLTEKLPVALLPIATKPLLEYVLESLLVAGITEAVLIISPDADLIETHFQQGKAWNIRLSYMLSRGEESPRDLLTRLGDSLSEGHYLLLRGDVLSNLEVISFLRQTDKLIQHCPEEMPIIAGTLTDRNAGVVFWNKQSSLIPDIDFLGYQRIFSPQILLCPCVEISGKVALLDSLKNFHATNMQVLAGEFNNLDLAGYRANIDLWIGRSSKLTTHNNHGIVGACCRVHPEARLLKQVVLNRHSIVDCGTVLENSVVMPDTYIGKYLDVRNAIVSGHYLIRVDNSSLIPVVNSFLLTDLTHKTFGHLFEEATHRGLALCALLLTAPLQLLLAGMMYWKGQSPRTLLQKTTWYSNHAEFNEQGMRQAQLCDLFEWRAGVRWIRHLPKLWAVVRGDLRLIGVMPKTPSAPTEGIEVWEKVRDTAPAGLLSPCQLVKGAASLPIEEQLLIEAHYARTRSLKQDIYWMGKALTRLFAKNAWSKQI
ncbi:MAG: NDP-sugar synthase [Thiotrichaceae bacterium]|nr:NDP-sugar synthase [Thiotrichaceae bacterium]